MFFKIRPDIALYTGCPREKSQKVIYLRSSVLSRGGMKCCVNDYIRVIIYRFFDRVRSGIRTFYWPCITESARFHFRIIRMSGFNYAFTMNLYVQRIDSDHGSSIKILLRSRNGRKSMIKRRGWRRIPDKKKENESKKYGENP